MAKVATYADLGGANLHIHPANGDRKTDCWSFRGGQIWPQELQGKTIDGLHMKYVELSELHIYDDRTGRSPDEVSRIMKDALIPLNSQSSPDK